MLITPTTGDNGVIVVIVCWVVVMMRREWSKDRVGRAVANILRFGRSRDLIIGADIAASIHDVFAIGTNNGTVTTANNTERWYAPCVLV